MPESSNENTQDWAGWRIQLWRERADMTQQELADAAGITREYVSMLERGKRHVSTRRLQSALATALGIEVWDLTNQPIPPRNPEELVLYSLAPAVRRALDFEDAPPPLRPITEVADAVDRSLSLRMHAEWEELAVLLPALLTETAAMSGDQARLLEIKAMVNAALTCRTGGYLDLARRCAERAVTRAAALGEPTHIGAAAFCLGQAALAGGSARHALSVTEAAAEALEDAATDGDTDARAITGMLHLASALSAGAAGDSGRAVAHLEEATYLAEGTVGDPWRLEFGRPNVGCWSVAVACELEHWDRAPELAARVDVTALRSPDRIARLRVDAGRGWYESGNPAQAVTELLAAMSVSARATRILPSVREVTAQMARDAGPHGGSSDLRRLVSLVGVDPAATQ